MTLITFLLIGFECSAFKYHLQYEFNSYYPNYFAFVPHSTWGTLVEGNCTETVLRNTGRDPVS